MNRIFLMLLFSTSIYASEDLIGIIQIEYANHKKYLYEISNNEYDSLPASNPSFVEYPVSQIAMCKKAMTWLQQKYKKTKLKIDTIIYKPITNKDNKVWYATISFSEAEGDDIMGINSVVILPNGNIISPNPVK